MSTKADLHADDDLCEVLARVMYAAQQFLQAHGYRVNLVIDRGEITENTEQPNRA